MSVISEKRFFGFDMSYLVIEWQAMFTSSSFRADLWAGITVALVALPLNLALAIAAGVEPGIGITTAIIASIITSLFGGQRYAISGPAAAMAVVLVQISQTHGIAAVWLVGIIAGCLQLLSGILRLGKFIGYIPMPVIVGFTNSIGILIIFNSLANFIGIPKQPTAHAGEMPPLAGHPLIPQFIEDVVGLIWHIVVHKEWNIYAIFTGGLVIFIALLAPRFTKVVPGQLIAIVLVAIISAFLNYDIPRIGDISHIPRALSYPAFPNLPWEDADILFASAIAVFLLGSIESLLSATIADGMTMSKKHHSDQELIGQGLANIITPFFGGIPITGVIARTAINIRAGARTRLSGIIHAVTLMILSMLFAKQAEQVPLAALSGILILTGMRLIEWDTTKQIWRASKTEGMITLVTTLVSVLMDLSAGVMIGLLLTCGLFIKQVSAIKVIQHEYDPDRRSLVRQPVPACKFVRTFLVDGPLFFGAAERFVETISNAHDTKVVILHMRSVHIMDLTGAESLLAINDQMQRKEIRLVLAELRDQPLELLEKTAVLNKIGKDNIFSDFKEAILAVNESLLESTCRGCASALKPAVKDSLRGPKDCLLRRAIVLNTDKIANILSERIEGISPPMVPSVSVVARKDRDRLLAITSIADMPIQFKHTPIEDLLRAQNMYDVGYEVSSSPSLIVGMCIDHRKQLYLPKNGAYIVRSPGANMRGQESAIVLALSAGVKYMALIVHNQCLMTNPAAQKGQAEHVLMSNHGWTKSQLENVFHYLAQCQIGDPISFALIESERLHKLFKGLTVIPLLYDVHSDRLFIIKGNALEMGKIIQSN